MKNQQQSQPLLGWPLLVEKTYFLYLHPFVPHLYLGEREDRLLLVLSFRDSRHGREVAH